MRKAIIEMKEMSDSKEVYGQRPNPVIAVFIYTLVGLLVVGLLFSCVGKIDIVATANGIIRPNDDISTASSLIGGRITSIFYSDGQYVEEGDVLLTVDTTASEITLHSLEKAQEDYRKEIAMLSKFLLGIEAGKNPFSSDPLGEEYSYYLQYSDYELSLKNAKDSYEFDLDKTEANISSVSKEITNVKKQIEGLSAYKSSVISGKNKAASYPDYESMYFLYASTMEALKLDYQTQREQLLSDKTDESNRYYLESYEQMIVEYGYLVESIQNGASAFPADYSGMCLLLWEDYCTGLAEYQRAYTAAEQEYHYYLNGGATGGDLTELLAYDYAMRDGYIQFQQSVENDRDMFEEQENSTYYRTLYTEYRAVYDGLQKQFVQLKQVYEDLCADPESNKEAQEAAKTEMDNAENACITFKAETLDSIRITLLQINAAISEKELSYGGPALEHNISAAQAKMESAKAAIQGYQNAKETEYKQTLENYKGKAEELRLTIASGKDKETLLAELDASYKNAVQQKYLQTITQIDNSIQSLESNLASLQSNLRLYEIASTMYSENVDENGTVISISLSTVEHITALLNQKETLQKQVDDLQTQIMQTKEQIAQGTVLAEKSGIVNVTATLTKGDMITAGMAFATVIPLNESEYKVQLYVSSADIAGIEKGNEIKYNVTALPSSQYGLVTGSVRNISHDVITQNGEYSGYYLVEGNIENKEVTDKDGNSGTITIGMQVEGKITTQQKTIIRYLLEKLNLS